jgi:hypothetical protein
VGVLYVNCTSFAPVDADFGGSRVPRIAAEALDLARITREMRDAGMVAPNIEMNVRGAGAGQVRVTCRTLVDVAKARAPRPHNR